MSLTFKVINGHKDGYRLIVSSDLRARLNFLLPDRICIHHQTPAGTAVVDVDNNLFAIISLMADAV